MNPFLRLNVFEKHDSLYKEYSDDEKKWMNVDNAFTEEMVESLPVTDTPDIHMYKIFSRIVSNATALQIDRSTS